MNTHPRTATILVLASVSFFTLPLTSAFGQAGLSGNPFSGQEDERLGRNSKFDNGKLKSQSALGQLEEISGGKVDRSSSQYSNRNARPVQQPAPAKPRYDPNQVLRQEVAGALAGALVGALFNNLLNDNSAQQKAEAEARARAEAEAQAEAFRVQQELIRQARIQKAQHYRAEWDSRESEITDRLGGAFDFHPAATAFFGTNPNPDADVIAALIGKPTAPFHGDTSDLRDALNDPPAPDAPGVEEADIAGSDSSVVDLRGSSLVVTPTNGIVTKNMPTRSSGSLMPRWAYEMTESPPPPRSQPTQLDALLDHFGPWLGKWYKETVLVGTAKAALWGFAKRKSQHFGENMLVEYVQGINGAREQKEGLSEDVGGIFEKLTENIGGHTTDIATSLANPNDNGSAAMERDAEFLDYNARKVKADTYEVVGEQMITRSEMPDPYELKSPTPDHNVVHINNVPDPTITELRGSSAKGFLHYPTKPK